VHKTAASPALSGNVSIMTKISFFHCPASWGQAQVQCMLTGQHACKGACKCATQLRRNRKRKKHPLGRTAASTASTATRAYPKRLMSVPALPSSAEPPCLAHPSGTLVTPATSPDDSLPRCTSLVRAPCTCATPLHAMRARFPHLAFPSGHKRVARARSSRPQCAKALSRP